MRVILSTIEQPNAFLSHMTTTVPVINESNMASGVVASAADDKTVSPAKEGQKDDASTTTTNPASPATSKFKDSLGSDTKTNDSSKKHSGKDTTGRDDYFPPTPTPHEFHTVQIHGYPVSLTPQTGSAYQYLNYGQHMTPEPPSPAGHHPVTDVYNVGSFFQPQTGGFAGPPHPSPFGTSNTAGTPGTNSSNSHINIPMSPTRGGMPTVAVLMTGGIPPASPLFPRSSTSAGTVDVGGTQQRGAPPSPSIPYVMSPQVLSSNMYQNYPVANTGSRGSEDGNWTGSGLDRGQPSSYPSPQLNSSGVTMSYTNIPVTRSTDRTYSFDESLLPSSALDQQDPANPAYSPYSTSQASPGGTLFTHPAWGYGTHPDMYNNQVSPLQQRAVSQIPLYPGMPTAGMRPLGPYGQLYPATSPGPPIQTTASNKGPDGANLFIFHIPNHFTNLDMYQLFAPYGNLLSVRIMVEKDTGRSRGFGFVSYDAPEAAAQAIKGLNGFAIGNKRLKVQHKQIKSRDTHDRESPDDSFLGSSDLGFQGSQFSPSLQPTESTTNLWHGTSLLNPENQQSIDDNLNTETVEYQSGPAEAESTKGTDRSNDEQSALSSLGQLQNALPEVTAQTTTTN